MHLVSRSGFDELFTEVQLGTAGVEGGGDSEELGAHAGNPGYPMIERRIRKRNSKIVSVVGVWHPTRETDEWLNEVFRRLGVFPLSHFF